MFRQIYLPQTFGSQRSGAEGRIHNTKQLLLLSHAVTIPFHIKMAMQAYQDDHYFVNVFVAVQEVITPVLF